VAVLGLSNGAAMDAHAMIAGLIVIGTIS